MNEETKAEQKALRHAQALENKRKRSREYYQAHKEEMRAKAREWNEAHKEERRASKKRYMENHREEVNSYMREYNSNNKERLTAQRKARMDSMSAEEIQALKDKRRAYDRERYLRRKSL